MAEENLKNRARKTCAYVNYSINLHSCVDDIDAFKSELKELLTKRFNPDFSEDIEIETLEHTMDKTCSGCHSHP